MKAIESCSTIVGVGALSMKKDRQTPGNEPATVMPPWLQRAYTWSRSTTSRLLRSQSIISLPRGLVAAPRLASEIADVEQLAELPTLSTGDDAEDLEWQLEDEDGRSRSVRVVPRMGCADMMAVRHAAIDGLGIAILPDHVCRDALSDGRLVRVRAGRRYAQGSAQPAA